MRTARDECLYKLLIINQAHLRQVRREFIAYYNTARPHQVIDQRIPVSSPAPIGCVPVRCRHVLGGILHDYYREAA